MRPFFEYARERQNILRRRTQGQHRPWTDDPILSKFRFCNVYREDDVTTQWFRNRVREPLSTAPEVLLATVIFRWFNRITTGEAVFSQLGDWDSSGRAQTAWKYLVQSGTTEPMKESILKFCGSGPYVTGAYIIKTPNGMNKLDGVLWCIRQFNELRMPAPWDPKTTYYWRDIAEWCLVPNTINMTLEQMWEWLRKFPYLGDFMAYEIVTDLRHTALLDRAPDIYTWANPGPGAMRGLNRLHGRDKNRSQPKHAFICEMRELLRMAEEEYAHIWPHRPEHRVEMRDIEHTLCEFDKYERVRLGEGRPRGVYR